MTTTEPAARSIPDRLSVDSPGYDLAGCDLVIHLDGVFQVYVLEYCISEGFIRRVKWDDNGSAMVNSPQPQGRCTA